MTAAEVKKIAVAPLAAALATKLTTPPFTGSTGLLAVTVTASGLANGVTDRPLSAGCCRRTGVRVKPWLSKAPMSTVPSTMRAEPRWSVVAPGDRRYAGVDGRAAGQQGHGLGRPAVVTQGGQHWVGSGRRWLPSGSEPTRRSCRRSADQVVRAREQDEVVRCRQPIVPGDDRVGRASPVPTRVSRRA